MKFIKNTTLKNIFISLMALCLFVNLIGDLRVYSQNQEDLVTITWVNQMYDLIQATDTFKSELLEKRQNPDRADKMDEALASLNQVAKLLPNQALLAQKLSTFTRPEMMEQGRSETLKTLVQMDMEQKFLLHQYLLKENERNKSSFTQVICAYVVDLLLILLLVLFFLWERKTTARNQNKLADALDRVEQLNQDLQLSMLTKDSIFKTAVHDLKNPLSSIVGLTELLAEDLFENAPAQKICKIIHDVSSETLGLVDSALKTDQEVIQTAEAVDVNQLIKETLQILAPTLDKKLQRISFDQKVSNFRIDANKRALQNIFFNVIGNASKFSPRGSPIIIIVEGESHQGKIKVIDQGPGFKDSDFDKLFTKGVSLSAKPTGAEISTGYGLFSVKRQLETMRGSIQVKNNQSAGATVELFFSTDAKLAA